MKRFRELWKYREMIINLVKRDLKSRYKGSVFGFFWMLLNPLLQLLVYTAVFSVIMRMNIDKFYLFLFVALVPWIFFNTCLSGGAQVIFSQQDMVKKIYFPREVLPLSFTISQFVNMLLSFIIVLLAVIFSGVTINLAAWLFLPLIMMIEFFLALGVTYIISALNVYFSDLEYITQIVAMVWMYLTPVIYPIDMVPKRYVALFYFNPMTSIVNSYRNILYYGKAPEMNMLINALLWSLSICVIGHLIFAKLQRHFVEEL